MNILVITKGYPRLSETFVASELASLEELGHELRIMSLRKGDTLLHPIHKQIRASITYIPEYFYKAPFIYMATLLWCCWHGHIIITLKALWHDIKHERILAWPHRLRRFWQALFVSYSIKNDDINLIYAHFMHTPASVARYSALLTGKKFAISAHAVDIWANEEWDIKNKIHDASAIHCCTKAAYNYLRALSNNNSNIHHIYHGIRIKDFPCPVGKKLLTQTPIQLCAIGRLVPKKGFEYLLQALNLLPRDGTWHFTHIGGGDNSGLQQFINYNNLKSHVTMLGKCTQPQVLATLRDMDIFIMPSIITNDGNRDGLPNVLLEAASQELMLIGSNISGIKEFIIHDQTGLLVPSKDAEALHRALIYCFNNKKHAMIMAHNAYRYVHEHFQHHYFIHSLNKSLTQCVSDT